MLPYVRSALGIVVGIAVISVVVEALEFALVTAVHGNATTDPQVYFGIRNRGWFLAVKLVYNTLGAIAGGIVAARIAGWAPHRHGIALAALQTLAFCVAVADPGMRQWTPLWMWAALIALSAVGILIGSAIVAARARPGSRTASTAD